MYREFDMFEVKVHVIFLGTLLAVSHFRLALKA